MENEFKTVKVKPLPPVEHQPKDYFIEMKVHIGDMNPVLNDKNVLFLSIPAVPGAILEPMAQLHLEDKLGKRRFQMLEEEIEECIHNALVANCIASRITRN